MWFDILKDAAFSKPASELSSSSSGLTFTLPEEEEEDKFPCCEEAREKALQIINFREKDFVKEANCEDLYWKIHNLAHRSDEFNKIREDWQECVHSLNDEHIEQEGWFNDYREVE